MRMSVAADAPDIGLCCVPQQVYDALVKVLNVKRKVNGGKSETAQQLQGRKDREANEIRARASRTMRNLLLSCRQHVQAAAEARAAEQAAERAAVLAAVQTSPPPADPSPHTHSAAFTR